MKKFILFFLFFLLIIGTGSLAFGFWNGKRIRNWAASASEIKARHNISAQEKKFEERFGSGWDTALELKNQSTNFVSELEKVSSEASIAAREIQTLSGPKAIQNAKTDLANYFDESREQIENIKDLVLFMNQLFDVAIIFDQIKENTTLEEIQGMISIAKEKSAIVTVNDLPESMKNVGNDLKVETDQFLDIIEQTASGKIESNDQLRQSYADFSREEDRFFQEAKKYVNTFEDLSPLEQKIDTELEVLGNVKFDLR